MVCHVEEVTTLASVWLEVAPVMKKVAVLCMVYMRGVHQVHCLLIIIGNG